MTRTKMAGERIPATRTMGGCNSRHRACGKNYRKSFSGGPSFSFGVLGPRRIRHNRIAKQQANHERRTIDRLIIQRSLNEAA